MNINYSSRPINQETLFLGSSVFFGSNYKIAHSIKNCSDLKIIVCEKRLFNKNIYNFAILNGIEFVPIVKKSELSILKTGSFDVGFSCGTGIIFTIQHMRLFEKGIWNFHYGPLPEVRGRHPISWAFLNNLPFGVTIHKIDKEIDEGDILAKLYIDRDLCDTQLDMEEKIEHLICTILLRRAIDNWKTGNIIKAPKGKYYESLANKFRKLKFDEHDSRYFYNLFKSQFKYGGVNINKKQYKYCTYYNKDFPESYEGYDIYQCKDGVYIAVK